MNILALETSCDESAAAIISEVGGKPVLQSSIISSQIELHREYGGVVPEVASRNHSLNLNAVVQEALTQADLTLEQIDGFAATGGPGLSSSLLIGHSMAKGFAVAARKPFYSINHMEGHLLSPFLSSCAAEIPPHLALIVSGGHTMTVAVKDVGEYSLIGKTIDDAAGEAFDKVARMLGLPYPGGPEIEQHAVNGDPTAFDFPRSLPSSLDFSFSGLKTSVLYTLNSLKEKKIEGQLLADLCASFQKAVTDSLVKKTLKSTKECEAQMVTISGGVSCNKALLAALSAGCQKRGITFLPCQPKHSTDNAAMIAYTAWFYHQKGLSSSLSSNIDPNLSLAHRS